MSKLRALFDRIKRPPDWWMIQCMHGATIVIGGILAVFADNRLSTVLGGFLIGNAAASIIFIGFVRRYRRIVDEVRDNFGTLESAFGHGRVMVMRVVPSAEYTDDKPTLN